MSTFARNMKRLIIMFISCLWLSAQAQTDTMRVGGESQAFIGYLSYDAVLRSMAQYKVVQEQITILRQRFEAEQKRSADEFNRKYEEFLEGRSEFPPTILRKRQMELQELMQKSIEFREQGRREISEATDSLMSPVYDRLDKALQRIGAERGYALIVNTDAKSCPYINPIMGEDITTLVSNAVNSLSIQQLPK